MVVKAIGSLSRYCVLEPTECSSVDDTACVQAHQLDADLNTV